MPNLIRTPVFFWLGLVIGLQPLVSVNVAASAKLVLIIDDIGYNLPLGKRAAELPGPITYGVIPHSPLAKKLAFYAIHQNADKEIIVHMPMESTLDRALGDGALTDDLSKSQFVDTLQQALANVPFARGLSNHMGSHLTALPDRMQWLMKELQQYQYFYLDSKTTASTDSQDAAREVSLPYLARDIFLDHDPSPHAIASAFTKALQLAHESGSAVVIAHPYPSTLQFLESKLPELADTGVELVTPSVLLEQSLSAQALAAAQMAPTHPAGQRLSSQVEP